jgi:predicted PurR-regulated permease PerM
VQSPNVNWKRRTVPLAAAEQRLGESPARIGGWRLGALVLGLLACAFFDREVLLPFILAAAAGFLLTPLVDGLSRRARLRRSVAAVLVYLGTLAVLGAVGYFVGGLVLRDAVQLIRGFPANLQPLFAAGADVAEHVLGGSIDATAFANAALGTAQTLTGGDAMRSATGYAVGAGTGTILLTVLLAYFLVSGKTVAASLLWLVPPRHRMAVNVVAGEIAPVLWRYFLGLAILVAFTWAVAWMGFAIAFHVPQAALLALAVGLCELVPMLGPALSLALVVATAIALGGSYAMVGLMGFAAALRVAIDQFVGPLVLGKAARVHPVVVIFSTLSGAALFGIPGLLLAVPFAASVKIVLAHCYADEAPGT